MPDNKDDEVMSGDDGGDLDLRLKERWTSSPF